MYVYIMQSGCKRNHPIKIGMSDCPEKRLLQLQTGNPVELRLLLSIKCKSRKHAFELEKTLHEILKGKKILNEWFRVMKSKIFKYTKKYNIFYYYLLLKNINNPDEIKSKFYEKFKSYIYYTFSFKL